MWIVGRLPVVSTPTVLLAGEFNLDLDILLGSCVSSCSAYMSEPCCLVLLLNNNDCLALSLSGRARVEAPIWTRVFLDVY